jgi:hypothetical protein
LVIDKTTKSLPNKFLQQISDALKRDVLERQGWKYCVPIMKFTGCVHDARMKEEEATGRIQGGIIILWSG